MEVIRVAVDGAQRGRCAISNVLRGIRTEDDGAGFHLRDCATAQMARISAQSLIGMGGNKQFCALAPNTLVAIKERPISPLLCDADLAADNKAKPDDAAAGSQRGWWKSIA